ncbi:PREDICTED: transcription elongation factor A N-terminal and central domain-containing protein [Nanorana parkeri]|uniref:transcription elongation factor A N-terminal and central domain-containing protein n=1 Tax=Nanorana parkeri TaxID=125878 RepID=UPI0008545597|nr:PREDICTED: transcription elongation factor A N-terminal and central domain-containing protein [Nanorana parkeri]
MLNATAIKELTYRSLQVERLLKERKYEEIMYHLSYFETLEVSMQTLQQTDVIRVVYRVLKSCSQGAMKKKAKCLLSKWKLLYKESCAHPKHLEEYHAGESKESFDKEIVTVQPIPENEQENVLGSAIGLQSSAATQETTAENTNSSTQAACCTKSSAANDGQKKIIAEELRVKCRELLFQALSDTTECPEKTNTYAKELEESIYNMYTGNDKKYRNCVRSKVSNLRNPQNSHLKRQIYSGALSPGAFATMTAIEMASDELQKLRASYTQTSVQEHQLPQGVDGLQTDKIKCRKCERFNCTVTMISRGTLFLPAWVRAGDPDEEMMTFVICNQCGEKWYHSRWICL